ncbi:PspC domain-containing protein [Cellulomonas sp. KRMCY2]|uniref:PspC domain-containing protein n=1 Tax=Cellulomonas sp. KRMCY2 TaxID=1304865 RepID=UPI0018CC3250|nr:PspC domain-containing protein [Cellulomonas sp. KRMCY2]
MNETPLPPQDPTAGEPPAAGGPRAGDQPHPAQPFAQQPYPQQPYAQQQYPQQPYPRPQRAGADSFFDGIRRSGIVRSDERWIGGVAGGVALRLGIDPLVVRGLFGVSVLLGGLGLILYGIGWLLLPEQRDGRIHLQQLLRGDFDVAVLGGFAVFVIGVSFPGTWFPGSWMSDRGSGWFSGLLWTTAVVVVIALIVSASRNRTGGPGGGHGPTTTLYPGAQPPSGAGPAPTSTYPGQPFAAPTTAAAAPPRRPEGPTTTMPPTTPYPTGGQPGTGPRTYPAGGYPSATHATPTPSTGAHGGYSAPYAQGPYGQAPYGQAPYVQTPPRGVPVTTLPRPAARRGPGAGAVGIVVALSLMTLATLLYLDRTGRFDGPVLLTAGAVSLVLLGIGIIVAGLRGRTSGGFGGLAVVALIVLIPLASLEYADWDGHWRSGTTFGEMDRTPTDVATAEEGYSLGAGDARIDLTELPLGGPAIEVPVNVGAGEVTIVLPEDGAYTADISVSAGEVVWLGDTITSGMPGNQGTEPYESDAVHDGASPDLKLDITVGFGTVTVVEEGR